MEKHGAAMGKYSTTKLGCCDVDDETTHESCIHTQIGVQVINKYKHTILAKVHQYIKDTALGNSRKSKATITQSGTGAHAHIYQDDVSIEKNSYQNHSHRPIPGVYQFACIY